MHEDKAGLPIELEMQFFPESEPHVQADDPVGRFLDDEMFGGARVDDSQLRESYAKRAAANDAQRFGSAVGMAPRAEANPLEKIFDAKRERAIVEYLKTCSPDELKEIVESNLAANRRVGEYFQHLATTHCNFEVKA